MSEQDDFWVCPDCGQENFAQSRFCELCGKRRGSSRPGPGPAVVASFRGEGRRPRSGGSDEESSRGAAEERRAARERAAAQADDRGRKVKVSMLDFSERIKAMFRRPADGGRRRAARRNESFNPVLTLVLAFFVWGMIRLVGAPFLLLLRFIAFLFTPFGLPVWLVLAYLYARNRRRIHDGVDGFKKRVQTFGQVVARAASSIAMLRGGVMNLFTRAPREEEARPGEPVRGASVRILDDDDWDDDDDFDEGGR